MRSWPLILLALALAGCGNATGPVTSAAPEPVAARYVPGIRVAAAGDIACPPGDQATSDTCRQGATARLVRRLDPKWVLALGDLQYEDGSWTDFKASYGKSWGTFKAKTKPVVGNHEYHTPGARGFYTYFGRKAPGYSATNIGTWRIYLLNSNCDAIDCAKERTWLRSNMAAHPRKCSAIAMHDPRYSSGQEHGSDPSMSRFWNIAYAHHVDLALAGHDHDYERFAPMDGSANLRRNGILSFVVGTGGKSLYQHGVNAPGTRYFRADKFGVLMLSLGDGAFSWNFRTIGGGVRDAGSHTCH